uniref:Uncharacterized protein n=1 Tax=Romanomermis culicivorax TaxID=13658 RepID=A0A915KH67_ROMCU
MSCFARSVSSTSDADESPESRFFRRKVTPYLLNTSSKGKDASSNSLVLSSSSSSSEIPDCTHLSLWVAYLPTQRSSQKIWKFGTRNQYLYKNGDNFFTTVSVVDGKK